MPGFLAIHEVYFPPGRWGRDPEGEFRFDPVPEGGLGRGSFCSIDDLARDPRAAKDDG